MRKLKEVVYQSPIESLKDLLNKIIVGFFVVLAIFVWGIISDTLPYELTQKIEILTALIIVLLLIIASWFGYKRKSFFLLFVIFGSICFAGYFVRYWYTSILLKGIYAPERETVAIFIPESFDSRVKQAEINSSFLYFDSIFEENYDLVFIKYSEEKELDNSIRRHYIESNSEFIGFIDVFDSKDGIFVESAHKIDSHYAKRGVNLNIASPVYEPKDNFKLNMDAGFISRFNGVGLLKHSYMYHLGNLTFTASFEETASSVHSGLASPGPNLSLSAGYKELSFSPISSSNIFAEAKDLANIVFDLSDYIYLRHKQITGFKSNDIICSNFESRISNEGSLVLYRNYGLDGLLSKCWHTFKPSTLKKISNITHGTQLDIFTKSLLDKLLRSPEYGEKARNLDPIVDPVEVNFMENVGRLCQLSRINLSPKDPQIQCLLLALAGIPEEYSNTLAPIIIDELSSKFYQYLLTGVQQNSAVDKQYRRNLISMISSESVLNEFGCDEIHQKSLAVTITNIYSMVLDDFESSTQLLKDEYIKVIRNTNCDLPKNFFNSVEVLIDRKLEFLSGEVLTNSGVLESIFLSLPQIVNTDEITISKIALNIKAHINENQSFQPGTGFLIVFLDWLATQDKEEFILKGMDLLWNDMQVTQLFERSITLNRKEWEYFLEVIYRLVTELNADDSFSLNKIFSDLPELNEYMSEDPILSQAIFSVQGLNIEKGIDVAQKELLNNLSDPPIYANKLHLLRLIELFLFLESEDPARKKILDLIATYDTSYLNHYQIVYFVDINDYKTANQIALDTERDSESYEHQFFYSGLAKLLDNIDDNKEVVCSHYTDVRKYPIWIDYFLEKHKKVFISHILSEDLLDLNWFYAAKYNADLSANNDHQEVFELRILKENVSFEGLIRAYIFLIHESPSFDSWLTSGTSEHGHITMFKEMRSSYQHCAKAA